MCFFFPPTHKANQPLSCRSLHAFLLFMYPFPTSNRLKVCSHAFPLLDAHQVAPRHLDHGWVFCVFFLQGAGQEKLGIYIKSVVKGGAADTVGTAVTLDATSLTHKHTLTHLFF